MSTISRARILGALMLACAAAAAAAAELAVNAQGKFTGDPLRQQSPGGAWSLAVSPTEVGIQIGAADLVAVGPDGARHVLNGVAGSAFWISDGGRIIAVTDVCDGRCPSLVRVLDLDGRELAAREVSGLSDPVLSSDGRQFALRHAEGTTVLDLDTLDAAEYPRLATFAAGGGLLAGARPQTPAALTIFPAGRPPVDVNLDAEPVRLVVAADGATVHVLTAAGVLSVDTTTGRVASLYTCAPGEEARDLRATAGGVAVGLRRSDGDLSRGELVEVDGSGKIAARTAGPAREIPAAPAADKTHESIPWPLAPAAQHPVGNTYGEYQNYGSAYLHPGFDVMATAGQAVYAVKGGVVKAILTTSGVWHWRVAIGGAGAGTTEGYLYAHLDEPTIDVHVGQTITAGQYLGNLVYWPNDGFHHCHFARIRDTGPQWFGSWFCVDNAHPDVAPQTETAAPVFEPAVGNQLLAFCTNETSSYQNPGALHGAVDIIAHVGDLIASNWVCSVQEIRYSIVAVSFPGPPLVDDKLAVRFDMGLDTYYNSPVIDPMLVTLLYKDDATCNTAGDYSSREFFHVITNSDGNTIYELADRWQAWDTTVVPDGDYRVSVTAIDAAGNAATASMTVTTANGNLPTAVGDTGAAGVLALRSYPNPGPAGAAVSFRLPAAGPVDLSVYDLAGRRVRRLVSSDLAAGAHDSRWDGRDAAGCPLPAGTYLLRLETAAGARTEKVVLLR